LHMLFYYDFADIVAAPHRLTYALSRLKFRVFLSSG
jgi:hypothetical protein